jgi:serine/threonine-protein kinase PknK
MSSEVTNIRADNRNLQDLPARYTLEEPLGSGAQGTVWRARDEHLNRSVAIKLLAPGADPALLRQEMLLLGQLRHPGLATVFDLDRAGDGRSFLVSELVCGEPLSRWWSERPIEKVLELLATLLGTLDFLHLRGVVHRDVKPDNILVEAGPLARLVDFGLATTSGQREVSGTLAYAAPEVLAGEAATPSADLYGVGVVLHEALFGRGPFDDRPGQQLLEDAQLPSSGHDAGLVQLCRALLSRHPSGRPTSAAEALFALERCGLSSDRVERSLAGRGLPDPQLIGNDRPRERLRVAIRDLAQGRCGATLLLSGAPGSGRSRLLDELRREARLLGLAVLDGHQALTAAAEEQPAIIALDASAERACVVDQLANRAIALAVRPTVLLLDDADPLGLALLEVLSQRQPPTLLTCATALKQDQSPEEAEVLTLRPLDPAQTSQLAASMVPAGWRSPALGKQLHLASDGNPGQATELLRQVAAERIARGPQAVPDLARALEEGLEATTPLSTQRAAQLTAPQLQVAALLALLPAGLTAAQQRELSDLLAVEVVDELLLSSVLVSDGEGRLRLRSALAQPLLARLSLEQRVSAVERALGCSAPDDNVARALVRVASSTVADDPQLVVMGAQQARRRGNLGLAARLYEAALGLRELDDRSTLVLELAALRQVLGQPQRAIELLNDALAGGAERPEELLACLADAYLRAGQLEAGLQRLEHEQAPRLRVARAKLLVFAGRYDEALDVAEALAGAEHDAALRAEIAYICGLAAMYLGHLDESEAALKAARDQAQLAAEPLLIARAENSLGMLQQRRSRFDEARASYERCVTIAHEQGHLPFEASFRQNLASVLQQQGDLGAALEAYRESLALSRRFGGGREMAQVEHNMARLLCQLGQLDEAEQRSRRSAQLARTAGLAALAGHNAIVLAEIALARGDLKDSAGSLSEAEAEIDAQDAVAVTDLALVRGRLALANADPSACLRALDEIDTEQTIAAQRIERDLLWGRAQLALPAEGAALPEAREVLRRALRLAEDTGEEQPHPLIHDALVEVATRLGDSTAGALHREAATRLLEANVDALPVELRERYLALPSRAQVRARAAARARQRAPDAAAPSTAELPNGLGDLPSLAGRGSLSGLDGRLLAALLAINKELNTEPDLQRLLERIIDHAVELAQAERGFLLMREVATDELRIRVARNLDQETIRNKAFKISRSIAEEVLRSGQPTLTIDAMQDERFAEQLSVHQLRLRSVLCVPLTVRRELRGAIYLDNRFRSQAFAQTQQQLIAALAEQAALALGNWELLEDNRRRQVELERLNDELARVNGQLEQTTVAQREQLAELSDLARSQRDELAERYRFDNVIGRSRKMRELFALMGRVRESDASVLIQGESGTGKEVVAQALHYGGPRGAGPFVGVNCAALPSTLLDSELFGYVRGAFTGAERDRRGLIERADGGTLFLDEVGDMPPELQVKLLRVLQERRFERLGSEEERASDFRLIAASNKDLRQLVERGELREDLFYRINVIRLELPPLRDRRDDIPLLVEFLLERHNASSVEFSKAALERLLAHDWPGNVRELENEVLRLIALGGEVIQPEDLSPRLRRDSARPLILGGETLKEALYAHEEQIAKARLSEHGGNVTEAARSLGMTRVGLHKLLKRHDIDASKLR